MASNTTAVVATAEMDQQFITLGVTYGLVAQMGLAGLAASVYNNWHQMKTINYIMSLFNIFCVIYQVLAALAMFYYQGVVQCETFQVVSDFSFHLFSVSFDCFMLYKTYIVSGSNNIVQGVAWVLLANRLVWSIYDLVKSGGIWDPVNLQCN
ncbi:hypothetical protein HDU98_004731, partial [Podochytrium sp. JEL0797]